MFHISKRKVGGIVLVRLHVLGRHFVVYFCRTDKHGAIAA